MPTNNKKLAELDSILFGNSSSANNDVFSDKMSQLDKLLDENPPSISPEPTIPQKQQKQQQPKKPAQTDLVDNVVPDNEQGWISATGNAIARGAIGIGEMGLGAAAGLDRLVDRYINAEPENDPDNWDLKQWAHSVLNEVTAAKNKAFHPATSGAKGMWASGVESFVTSAGVKVPAYILATLTAPVTGLATVGAAGAGMLGLLATSPVFGLQQYDQAVDRYVKEFTARGIDPEKARNMAELPALMEGSYEVLSESLSDIIEGKLIEPGIGKGRVAAAGSTLRMLLKDGVWKEGLKRGAGTVASEQIGETLNSLAQLATQEVYGKDKKLSDVLTDDKFWKNMEIQFGQIAVSSILFGGLVAGGHIHLNNKIANSLENPVAKKSDRVEAANIVANDIAKESEALAKVWHRTSMAAIDRNEAISLDDPIDQFGVEDPASSSGRLARALIGEEPLPTDEAVPPIDEGPTNEDEIGDYYSDEVLAGMAAGETAPDNDTVDQILIDKGFSKDNIDFIKKKIASLGSYDKVNEFYDDDAVGNAARAYARNIFSEKESKGVSKGEPAVLTKIYDALKTQANPDDILEQVNNIESPDLRKEAIRLVSKSEGNKLISDIQEALKTGKNWTKVQEQIDSEKNPDIKEIAKRLMAGEENPLLAKIKEQANKNVNPQELIQQAAEIDDVNVRKMALNFLTGNDIVDVSTKENETDTTLPEFSDKYNERNVQKDVDNFLRDNMAEGQSLGDNGTDEGTIGYYKDKVVYKLKDGRYVYVDTSYQDKPYTARIVEVNENQIEKGRKETGSNDFEFGNPQAPTHEDRVKSIREGMTTELPADLPTEISNLYSQVNDGGEINEEEIPTDTDWNTVEGMKKLKDFADSLEKDLNYSVDELASEDNPMDKGEENSLRERINQLRDIATARMDYILSSTPPGTGEKITKEGENVKETSKENTEKGQEEKTGETGKEKQTSVDEEINNSSINELEAMFDEAGTEAEKPAQEQPQTKGVRSGTGTTNTTNTSGSETKGKTKTAADIIGEAINAGVGGIDEAMKGLHELFGGHSLMSFPAGFNQETYAKAKPHFEAALAKFREAGKSLKEFISFIKDQFGAGIKPYLMQFFKDIQAENGVGAEDAIDVTEKKAETSEEGVGQEKTGKKKGKGRRKERDTGGKITGLRKDMQDAIVRREDIDKTKKPVEAILRKTNGIIRTIRFKKEASFGLPRVADYINSRLITFTEWAGYKYGGSRSKYARFTFKEAIQRMFNENPDIVIADANNFIEVHTKVHNALVEALTIDDALRGLLPLFVDQTRDNLPDELKSVDAWKKAVASGNAPLRFNSFLTNFGLNLKDNYSKTVNLPFHILEETAKLEETQFDDEKNKEYKREKQKVTEIETDARGRNGEDVDSQKLIDDFGFWGVAYGKWTNKAHRQASLNLTYDSFYELLDVLGIPESKKKVFSLPNPNDNRVRNGEEGTGSLSIAYGAMARGGKFSAAYYPSSLTIGLTRDKGDGSLGHEWSHALNDLAPTLLEYIEDIQQQLRYRYVLDNAEAIVEQMVRNSSSRMMGETGATFESIKEHLIEEFDSYFKKENDFFTDAKKLDNLQGGICGQQTPNDIAYWSNDHELWARSFEAWISDSLAEKNRSAEYLVRRQFVEDGSGERLFNHENEAYPKGETRQYINDMFKYFFDNIEWSLDGNHSMKEGYEKLGEKNRREAREVLDQILVKGEELFNEIYKSEPSKDGLYWYAYKNTARGSGMQPDGFFAYDDKFKLEEGHPERGTGEGAIAYPERLSIEQTRNFGLAPIAHNEDSSKVYTGGANDTNGSDNQGILGADETGHAKTSQGEGGAGQSAKGGVPTGGATSVAGNEDDTGRKQGNGTEEGEGDSGTEDVSIPNGEGNADTAEGDVSVSAAKPKDYALTRDDDPQGKSTARRFSDNISAIEVLHTIESENRLATKQEQAIMAKYSGWYGMNEVFSDHASEGWKIQSQKLKDILTQEELMSLSRAMDNETFNTPHGLGDAIFNVLQHIGFMGGRVLDVSTGIGNLFGLMPQDMRKKSSLVGVEPNGVVARMTQQLYQNARIQNTTLQDAPLIENSFDLVVSNTPFSTYGIPRDKEHNSDRFSTQFYFVNKALNLVRPGGIVAVIASDSVLNSGRENFTNAINMKGELLGAFRLPTSVFSDSQEPVVSDLLFIRKKGVNLPNANVSEFKPHTTIDLKTESGYEYPYSWAQYFKEHEDHVLGDVIAGPDDNALVEGDATDALSKIPSLARKAFIGGEYKDNLGPDTVNPLENIPKPGDVKPGGIYTAQNGLLYVNGEQVDMGVDERKKMKSMLDIRDTIRKLLRESHGDESYGTAEEIRKELNDKYDQFVKDHGYLHSEETIKLHPLDPDLPLLLSLENWDAINNKFLGKSNILTKTLSMKWKEPLSSDNAQTALNNSLAYKGRVDLPYMSSQTGMGREQLIDALGDLIYDDPQKGWVTAEEYLSGHIGRKLKIAEKVAAGDERFKRNVDALKNSLPEKVPAKDIKAQLGAPWIPPMHIENFISDISSTLGDGLNVHYNKYNGTWEMSWSLYADSDAERNRLIQQKKNSYESTTEWGVVRVIEDADGKTHRVGKNFYDLLNYALNGGIPKVSSKLLPDTLPAWAANASEEQRAEITTNELLTDMAMQKLEKIKREFSRWIMASPSRSKDIETKFNELFTGFTKRKFSGEHMPFVGKVPDEIIKLTPHQTAAVWRFITDGNAYLGHEVGTGKTFTMVASIMESKRLGLMKKPILAVTADTYDQIAGDFLELYPGANIYRVDFTGKSEKEKKQIYEDITAGNWDAIIVKHHQLDKLPVDTISQANLLREELAKKKAALRSASSRKYQSAISKEIRLLEDDIDTTLSLHDPSIPTLESMGIDGIVVDEAHIFKNLKFKTRYGNVKGLGGTDSRRANDLYLKVRSILSRYGRNVLFASGTPISNSIAELYLIQRYLQQDVLDERMINSFDMWVNTFARITSEAEPSPQGSGFRMVDKVSSYHNLPELLNTVHSVLDIVRTADTDINLPKIKGGGKTSVHVPANKYVKAFRELLIQRTTNIKNLGANAMYGGKRDILLSVITAGRKAALDVRLINKELPDSPDTKVNHSIDKIVDIYHAKHERVDGTIEDKPVQFIFLDLGVPNKRNKEFNVYEDIKKKLIEKGIPESEIAFAQDYKDDKLLLSARARSGDARIVIGSTKVLGVGINAQDRLAAIHNLDIEWNYANYEQRLGRMLRRGNMLKEVSIFDYGTQESLDMFLWSKVYDKKVLMDQALYSSDNTLREFVDESADAAAAGEMLMALTNDPLQVESIALKQDVRKLSNQRLEWQYNLNEAKEKKKEIPSILHRLGIDEKRYSRGLELFKSAKGVVIGDEILDLKKDAKKIIDEIYPQGIAFTESEFSLVDYTEEETEVIATDKDGKPIVDKKKQKEGVLAPASFKTNKQKIRTKGKQVGTIGIALRDMGWIGSERMLSLKANNGLGIVNEITDREHFPSIARTLSDGIRRYEKSLAAIPEEKATFEKEFAQAEATLATPTFPHEEELAEKEARLEEISGKLVENLRRAEEERAANPQATNYLDYFPEPTPPSEQRDNTPETNPLFSRDKSRRNETLGKKMVTKEIQDVVKNLSLDNAPPIVAVQSETDLPSHVLADIVREDAHGEVPALFDHKTGKVYLIGDNLRSIKDIQESIVHEVMGHFGLRGLMPKEQLIPILEQVADFYGADGLYDIASDYGLDLARREDRIRAAEEKLAFAQQERLSEKERGFFKTIYAKIRQFLRKAGFVHTMTDNDIAQLLLDARKFAQGKIDRDSNPYPFGSTQVYKLSKDVEPLFSRNQKRGKSLYRDVQERLDKAQGKTRETLKDHAQGWLEKFKHATRHFPLLDPKKWGNLTNYLRVYEEVPNFSKYVAEQEIRKFIKDLNNEEYDVFRMNIILGDLLKDVNKGLYDEVLEAGEPLPFGYKDKESLIADVNNIASQVEDSEAISKAINDRKKYMNTLKESLVAEKLLPKKVLDDDEYFHHQVLEYLNEKTGMGISSKDVRLKKKGFQKGRKGYTGDYNTEYVEAEFEVISHAISQLETKHLMDRLDKDHNIIGDLREKARSENIDRVYKSFKYDPNALDNPPGSNPFSPFRQQMAIAFSRIGEMGSKGMLEVPLEMEDTLGRLIHEYESKKAQQNGDDFISQFQPNNEHIDDPGVFKLLSFLLNRGKDGAREAAMIFKAIQDRNKFISAVLGKNEVHWKDLVDSTTHTIWRPKPNTAWYLTNSINDRIIERVVRGERALNDEDVRKVLARGADVEWVIPKEIAQTLDNFKNFQEDTAIGEISKKILNTWKQWVLINPLRFFKYNINNMSGDADITFAYAPEIIKKYTVPAFKDLINEFRKKELGEEISEEFREAVRQGVLNAGITAKEIPDITKAMEFEHAMKAIIPKNENQGLKVLKRGAKGAWFFLKDTTNLRENVLRLAAYRYFKDQIAAGNKPLGVSDFTKTSQIKDANERAAMLSRELLGDYGNLSQTSEWLRQNLIPFWSWQAINAPRYFRLYQNLHYDERTGAAIRGAGTLAWKGGKTSLKVALLYAMINAWNAVFWPDEEEALGDSGRRQLHLIIGKRKDGHIISLRLQGALSDALGWFSLEDFPSDVLDVAAGRATIGEKIKESLEAPVARIYQGSRPLLKSVIESGVGLSTYPSFSSPRPVRDKFEHFLRAFSLDKFWDFATGKPKVHGSVVEQIAKDFTSVFFYDTDVDVTNYYDIRKKVFDFREKELGIPPETNIPSNKSTALYYYKQAFRLGDVKAAEKYLQKYFDLGGTVRGIHTSIRLIHPLGGLAKKYRARFLHSLSPAEKIKYRHALKWYRDTYTKRHPEFKGVTARVLKKSRAKKKKDRMTQKKG